MLVPSFNIIDIDPASNFKIPFMRLNIVTTACMIKGNFAEANLTINKVKINSS